MRRCLGITRNLNRCGRTGSWKFFCEEHKKQPLIWLFILVFTVGAGTASILSYLKSLRMREIQAIGSPPSPSPALTPSATLNPTTTPREHINPSVLPSFDFDVVTVDAKGKVTKRPNGRAQYFVEDLGGGVMLDMVEIPGGAFLMGSSESEVQQALADANLKPDADNDIFNNEKQQHRVNVPTFFMGKFEVTQAQWRAVARMPQVKVHLDEDPAASVETDSYPVEQVKWVEAEEFCERLSRYTGRAYRLPTEAEWEYACRAGTKTPFAFGETITPDLVNYESDRPYGATPKRTYRGGTIPVGSLGVANGFGLYDMHGNVKEWCLDGWHEDYDGAPLDGNAWWSQSSALRVARGGSWLSDAFECRCAFRDGVPMNRPRTNIGFRVVMETQP